VFMCVCACACLFVFTSMNAHSNEIMNSSAYFNTYATVRFSESSGGLLESCLLQHNDIAVAINDCVRCAVYSSLFQHNQVPLGHVRQWIPPSCDTACSFHSARVLFGIPVTWLLFDIAVTMCVLSVCLCAHTRPRAHTERSILCVRRYPTRG